MILEENMWLKTQKLLPKEQNCLQLLEISIKKCGCGDSWEQFQRNTETRGCFFKNDTPEGSVFLKNRWVRPKINAKQFIDREICKLQSVDMVITAAISDRLHLKWWICFSVTVSRVLAKCTGSSSVLNRNCKFEHRSTDLHTNTLWHLLNHLFAAFNHFNQFFWSSFSNVCLHTLHGSLRFCVCLEISTFGVSACTRPIYTLIFHIWDMPLNG